MANAPAWMVHKGLPFVFTIAGEEQHVRVRYGNRALLMIEREYGSLSKAGKVLETLREKDADGRIGHLMKFLAAGLCHEKVSVDGRSVRITEDMLLDDFETVEVLPIVMGIEAQLIASLPPDRGEGPDPNSRRGARRTRSPGNGSTTSPRSSSAAVAAASGA